MERAGRNAIRVHEVQTEKRAALLSLKIMGGSPYKRGYRGLKAHIATSTKTRETAIKAAFPTTN